MDDKTLAEKAAKLGGFVPDTWGGVTTYRVGLHDTCAERFVRDPRVAMALMERCMSGRFAAHEGGWVAFMGNHKSSPIGDSLPRAIVEACCLALEES